MTHTAGIPGGADAPAVAVGELGSDPVDRQRAATMADYHNIVEQIRTALHSGDPGHNGRLAGLASAYADACAEAAQRLGRCHRLLQQGLRTEAIQLAESEPKLLDALAVLDFPERPEWDDMVQARDLTPAPASRSSRPGCSTRRIPRRTRSRSCSAATVGWPCSARRCGCGSRCSASSRPRT